MAEKWRAETNDCLIGHLTKKCVLRYFSTTLAVLRRIIAACGTSVPCPAASATAFPIMTDHYGNVKVQLEQMKSFGDNAEKEGDQTDEQGPVSSPPAPLSSDTASITLARRDVSDSSGKHGLNRERNRSKAGKDDKNSCGKHILDLPLHGTVVSAHVGKNLNRLGHERTLNIKGTGRILQGKLETNGNFVTIHPSKKIQDTRRDDEVKLARKRRPVTVDSSKAKTSLEALKLSIKQLKWKEVCYIRVYFMFLVLKCLV